MYLILLAEIVLNTVEKYDNLKSQIIQQGHFNGRVHSTEQMSKMVMRNYVRYLTNIARGVTYKDFKMMMDNLAEEIYRVAEGELYDIINQAHARKKVSSRNQTFNA